MKPQPSAEWCPQPEIVELHDLSLGEEGLDHPLGMGICNGDGEEGYVSKYGVPGDRLWVRETFQFIKQMSDGQRHTFKTYEQFTPDTYRWIEYAATPRDAEPPPIWKPSIFMPRWASRITLEIVSVRAERLQDIQLGDCIAEGIELPEAVKEACRLNAGSGEMDTIDYDPTEDYKHLWESINGKNSWSLNPWCWCLEFKKIK